MRLRALLAAIVVAAALPAAAAAAESGRVGGVVVAHGTPQLGATVVVTPEARPGSPIRLMTNTQGVFASTRLLPGVYSVRVRLAGFLPAFEPRIHVTAGQLILLRIELGSVFSSVERLRDGPGASNNPEEWKWVLRSASLTRPILRFVDGRVVVGDEPQRDTHASHGRAELTAGSLASWSPASPQPVGSTSFLYDHGFGAGNRLRVSGRVGYEHSTASAVAANWTHSADALGNTVDSTTIVFRQTQLGPAGPSFRGMEIDSNHRMQLSDRVEVDFGGQYIVATMANSTAAFRPDIRLNLMIDPEWTASFLLGSVPQPRRTGNPLDEADSFPTPVENAGHLALDSAWHEEISVSRRIKHGGAFSAAIFHDTDANTAVFGRGSLPGPNTIVNPFSDAFVYDGGSLRQWGARVGYTEKISPNWKAAFLYDWSVTLAPGLSDPASTSLKDMIEQQRRNSLAGRLSGRIERTDTEISAGYQWINGPVLTRPDPFGSALYGMDPYLNVSVRQPLPNFLCCRIVAIVDVRNLLAQGYVSLETVDGRALLIPAARAIRGGFAVQF